MTVKDLIQRLSIEDQEMRIVVDGYEEGFDELDQIRHVKITPNPKKQNKHWEGEFDQAFLDCKESEIALYFPRKS